MARPSPATLDRVERRLRKVTIASYGLIATWLSVGAFIAVGTTLGLTGFTATKTLVLLVLLAVGIALFVGWFRMSVIRARKALALLRRGNDDAKTR